MRGTAADEGPGNDESMERGLAGTRLDLEADKEIGSALWTRHLEARVGSLHHSAMPGGTGSFGHRRPASKSVQPRRPTESAERPKQGPTTSQEQGKATRATRSQSAAWGRGRANRGTDGRPVPRACGVGGRWQRAIGRVEDLLCSPDRRAVLERRVHRKVSPGFGPQRAGEGRRWSARPGGG